MNLAKLFEMQRELDQHIVKEKGLEEQDLLPQKMLALQVELGELANEWRGFKFWSEVREPRTEVKRHVDIPGYKAKGVEIRNPLLEEYVDCLHFILSIGLELNVPQYINRGDMGCRFLPGKSIVDQFNEVFLSVSDLEVNLPHRLDRREAAIEQYYDLFLHFILLGEMLGFSWQEVEQAYFEKNQVNHQRQESGY